MVGIVNEFWLTPGWTTTQSVHIELQLYNKNGTCLLWEQGIQVDHIRFIGLRSSTAFEGIIQEALDKAFAQAIEPFETDEFQQKVSGN